MPNANSPLMAMEQRARHSLGQPYVRASQLGELAYCELQGWLTYQGFERSQQAQARMAVGEVKHQQLSQAADDVLELQQKAIAGLNQARERLGSQADVLALLVQKGDLAQAQALAQQLSQDQLQRAARALAKQLGSQLDPELLGKIQQALLSPDPRAREELRRQLAAAAQHSQQQAQQMRWLAMLTAILAVILLGMLLSSEPAPTSYLGLQFPIAVITGGANVFLSLGVLITGAGAVYFWLASQKQQQEVIRRQQASGALNQALSGEQQAKQAARDALKAGALKQEASRKQTQDLKLPAGAELLAADGSQTLPQAVVINRLYGLVGRPDKVIKYGTYLVPVEEKPKAPRVYDSHRIQALAYCLLIEQDSGVTPPYALVITRGGSTEIPWDDQARLYLFRAIVRAREILTLPNAPKPTATSAQCKVCGVRKDCPTPVF